MEDIIVDILESFLGDHRKHNVGKGQIAFDCPACAEEKGMVYDTDGKGNLEINYKKGVFRCWACDKRNNMRGHIDYLFKKYGAYDQLREFNVVKPDYDYYDDDKITQTVTEKLPDEYLSFDKENSSERCYSEALSYLLRERGLTKKMIKKYKIGFTNSGDFRYRIIIPSFDENGILNYFLGRTFREKYIKPKYRNSDTSKEDIIFNHHLINPYANIHIVEGPMDSLVVPNSITLMGLKMSPKLMMWLQDNAKAKVIIILDGEAKEDAELLYNDLNTMNLYNKVRIVYLAPDLDTSEIFKKYKNEGIKAVLKSSEKMNETYLNLESYG